MKWGRKKSPSPSTHCQSLINRVFPVSWLVKFKQNGASFEPNSAQKQQKSKLKSPSSRSYQCANWKEGRFRNMDDDVYWKLLFEEERIKARKSSRGMNSVEYYSDDELGFPTENNQQFNDMALDTRKMKEIQHEMRNTRENYASRKKKATYKTPRRKAKKDQKSKNLEAKREENERGSDEEKSSKSDENDIYEIAMESRVVHNHMKERDFVKPAGSNSRKQHGFFCPSSSARKFVEECTSDDLNSEESNANSQEDHFSLDRQLQCEDKKIKDYLISSIEPRRKSAYISRTKQKVKVYSPRTECKIRGLEDIKKARMKSKKKTRERGVEVEGSRRVFDNFAVVKCSFAPERDFRDSMVEMIREKGIRRPDELEELLACYLTLNCDKYHDLIIKAFQQVWLFELNQEFINLEIGKDHQSYDK